MDSSLLLHAYGSLAMQIHNQSKSQIRESYITDKIKYQTIILVHKDIRPQTNVECVQTYTHRIGQQIGDCDRTIRSAISVVLTMFFTRVRSTSLLVKSVTERYRSIILTVK